MSQINSLLRLNSESNIVLIFKYETIKLTRNLLADDSFFSTSLDLTSSKTETQ